MILKLEALNDNNKVAWCCYENDSGNPIPSLNGYVDTSNFAQYENDIEIIALITLMSGPLRIHAGIKDRITPCFPSLEKRVRFLSSKYELMRIALFPEINRAFDHELSFITDINNEISMLAVNDDGLTFTSHFFEYNLFIPFNLINTAMNKMKVSELDYKKSIIHLLDRELVRQCLYKERFGGRVQCIFKGLSLKFTAKKDNIQLLANNVESI
ncbi:hypothetical protein [Vibrio algivorus]|uniref:Uncharacterized protein n=1 Tax=Vibrio algivorus TaxID=1667024 RepID=A0A557P2L6_9VIBR|nr:hypothetical protein [Vibrio algivorus]TVO34916.1 hypothetical protein FOF44_12545 [Vibrio algivorus]